MIHLRPRWQKFARPEHAAWTWRVLSACYSGPERAYHDIHHIHDCLELLDRVQTPGVDKRMAEIALWWHDAVYVAGNTYNERLSADLVCGIGEALEVDERELKYARRCILATCHTESWKFSGNPTVDAVLDIDLSILGSSPDEYDTYTRSVRREFAHVDEESWRKGRSAFLLSMVRRPRIYLTDEMGDWFDHAARENMTREIGRLSQDTEVRA
jgi:predicted metal-dependent HD superfamily phosphohydrolase